MNKKECAKYTNLPIVSKGKINKEEILNKKGSKMLTVILVFITIVILLLCGYSMAKTMEEVIVKSNMQVAEPIFIVEDNPSIDITAENNYGVYNFKIKNYDNQDKITETDLKYYIEVLGNVDDSVDIELYQGNNLISLNNNKTEYMKITKNKKEEIQYDVKIAYKKDRSNNIEDILEKIQIKVHAEQIKA